MENPKIRFKGFTKDWEQRKLGDIINEYKETVDSDCILPILTSSKTEGVILQEEHFGRKQQHDITGYNILPRNYCTYRNRSDGVDFTFNINKCCDKGIISKFYPVFSGKNSDVFFLSLVLNNSEEVVREIAYTCTGTGQKVLSFLDLQKMKVRVPNFDEQKEIAAYFESLDHLITLHQRKCDQTKNLKKYMLQKMFPQNGAKVPEIRFDGYTYDWEQRKLGELVKEGILEAPLDGNHGEKHPTSDEYVDSGIPFLMASDIHNGEVNIYSCKYITKERAERLDKGFARNGDVLLTHKATIGETAILSNLMTEYAMLTPQVTYYRIKNEERLNREYLYSFFNSLDFQTELKTKAAQSTRPYIGITAQQNLKIILPAEINEQIRIGLYFRNLDHLITLHQRQTDFYKKPNFYFISS